jgi:SHS2 domain-containing protein
MYETFEHTADVGLRVRAASTSGLFEEAARGLFSVMLANLAAVRPIQELHIQLQRENIEDLWHDWLSELLFAFHGRRLVLAAFEANLRVAERCNEGECDAGELVGLSPMMVLDAIARGEPIDLGRHEITAEVKAVTWHRLRVEQRSDGWVGEVILDI